MPLADARRATLFVWLLLLCIAAASGCSKPGGRAGRSAGESLPALPVDATLADAAEEEPDPVASATDFKPPFPEREQLFVPSAVAVAQGMPQTAKHVSVQLKGFANRDGLHALVTIDGRLRALRAGEACGQVEVVAIVPPEVTFKQAEHTWNETLFTPRNRQIR